MKKKYTFLLAAGIVAAGICTWYIKTDDKEQAVIFVTSTPHYGYISKGVTATGTIEPVDTVSVGAQVSGVVKKVLVDFNSVVKKGQLLAQVDPSILKAQDEEAKANLTNANSNLVFQKSTFERQNELFSLGAISKADYQLALSQYNTAKAAVDNSVAQVRVTDKTLSYTNIYSPVNGVVLNRNVSAGQTIASSFNAPVLFVIAKDLTKMQVNAAVDEADIGGVTAGQNVSFTVDAFPNDVFKGIVQEIFLHPSVSANVVTYTTLIDVDNTSMKLKPGMTASITIYTEEDNNALLIPSRDLNFKPDSSLTRQYKMIKVNSNYTDILKQSVAFHTSETGTGNKSDVDNPDFQQSYIWVKTGDTLTEKRIITSLNDGSNVKVIKGVLPTDNVVTTIVTGRIKNSSDNAQRSPFMPQIQNRQATPSKK